MQDRKEQNQGARPVEAAEQGEKAGQVDMPQPIGVGYAGSFDGREDVFHVGTEESARGQEGAPLHGFEVGRDRTGQLTPVGLEPVKPDDPAKPSGGTSGDR
jgi:hypothetical protein